MTTAAEWLATQPSLLQLEPEDRAWATNFLRHASGDWGNNQRPGDLANDLHRCRRFRPHAAAWLILHSTVAARIAAHAGWTDTKHHPTQDEIAHVEAALATIHAQQPIRTTREQLDALSTTPLHAYPLTPTALDQLNPLPNGRKRTP